MQKTALQSQAPPRHPLIAQYLQHVLIERGLAHNTVAAYSSDLAFFEQFLHEHSLTPAQITESELLLYLVHIRKHNLGARSLARHLSSLRSLFTYARSTGAINTDPAQFLENPKVIRQIPEILSQEEIKALFAVPNLQDKLGFRDRTMLEILYASGLRVSELCTLKVLDFDPQTNLLRVFGKGSKERFVPMHQTAASFLTDYLQHWRGLFSPKCSYLFLNRSGNGLSRVGIWKLIKRYALEAQVYTPLSPHTFRHSFATHLLEGGADLRSVQMLLGHADVAATEIYTHVQRSQMAKVHKTFHPRSHC